eukprot:Filipodium_phascolosomae@DN4576_c0_g1_i1.p1
MSRKAVCGDGVPPAGGPYSPAVVANGFAFISGQMGTDSNTKALVSSDFRGQLEQTMENLKATLAACGSSMEAVVKTTVYVTDMSEKETLNFVYSQYFPGAPQGPPARTTIQVVGLFLDALVEIEAVAIVP